MNAADHVQLYTDGACSGNPGPGGWGALLICRGHEKELKGAEARTTNNRMELMAVIEGLRSLKKSCSITIFTDSRYVQQGMETWIHGWLKNGWKTANKKPVINIDLWQALLLESKKHKIIWQWVKGHSGHPENERVDALARLAISELLL